MPVVDGACFNHPYLPPDAWHQLFRRMPAGLGVEALAVCRNECPVRQQCLEEIAPTNPVETIAGGSWWDVYGVWHDSQIPDNISSSQAILYLGVSEGQFRELRKLEKIAPSSGGASSGKKKYYRRSDLDRAREELSLVHGTVRQYRAHLFRGEPPCARCLPLRARSIAQSQREELAKESL